MMSEIMHLAFDALTLSLLIWAAYLIGGPVFEMLWERYGR